MGISAVVKNGDLFVKTESSEHEAVAKAIGLFALVFSSS